MNRTWALLIGAGIGAGMSYFYDPEKGKRRRALVRDQATRLSRQTRDAFSTTEADVRGRARGIGAAARSWRSPQPVADEVLAQRVRAAIGRVTSHPGSIEVSARDGRVSLSGPALAAEIPVLIDRVYDVRGVRDIENRLQAHAAAGNVPGLQGGAAQARGPRSEFLQSNWSPAARLTAGAGGAAAALYGFARRGIVPRALAFAGLTLAARAATNLELRRLTGIGAQRRAIDLQKSIRINAPVERVFETWANCEGFPHFMTHVRKVRRLEDGASTKRWRWTVAGPAGSEFEFDTVTTAYEPNRVIGWRTEPGALIQHAGIARFEQEPNGTTRADVQMTYNPVAGAVGHVIAKLFGSDPKSEMDDDLLRMKSYIETGKQPRDAAAATATQQPRPSA